ncbi:hypothetical protein [Aeropyrum camini]|uniref:hypothetical protein n=1 Tax=Aeropyrum camini TaxID=229980 RepID=UPI0011E5E5D7|nr:hypothetical protein [Aeropyrum camini]
MEERPLERLVILSGVTGTEISSLLSAAEGEQDVYRALGCGRCVFKFEELVEDLALGPCGDISQLVKLLQVSRPSARGAFRRALDSLRERVERAGCRVAVVSMHLSYLSRDVPTPNPVLGDVVGLAREVIVVHVSEDWYDLLDAIAERLHKGGCAPQYSPYSFNPLTLLYWRGIDMSVAEMLRDFFPNVESMIYAVKHPRETTVRLLRSLLGLGVYEMVYVSHPITRVRSLYLRLKERGVDRPLGSLPLVKAMEGFKRAYMESRPDTILFDPTTIDEKILDLDREVYKAICGGEASLEGRPVYSFIHVNHSNRWPTPPDSPKAEAGRYKHLRGSLNLVPAIGKLAGSEEVELLNDVCRGGSLWAGYTPLARRVEEVVDSHIEIRDYKYVEQSKYLIVLMPTLYSTEEAGGEGYRLRAWSVESQGVYNEVARAQALAKPVYVYILPISLEAAAADVGLEPLALLEALEPGPPCDPKSKLESPEDLEAISELVGACARRRMNPPFNYIPSSARIFVARPLASPEDLRRATEIYRQPGSFRLVI